MADHTRQIHKARELRAAMTDAERVLWAKISRGQLRGYKFRKQVPLGPYIADFICYESRLVIELDGSQHLESKRDAVRDAWFTKERFTVLRFWNDQVLKETANVLEEILRHITPPPSPLPQGEGETSEADRRWMRRALGLAQKAKDAGEVPVGAVVVLNGEIIGEGFNQPIALHDPSAHAEMMALREAAKKIGNYRLTGSTLYVTLEPCVMCAGAMVHARVQRLVFGATDPKAGSVNSVYDVIANPKLNHVVEWAGGVLEEECGKILREFFKARR